MTALCGFAQSYGPLVPGANWGRRWRSHSCRPPPIHIYRIRSISSGCHAPSASTRLGLFIGAGMALIIGGEVIGVVEKWRPSCFRFGQLTLLASGVSDDRPSRTSGCSLGVDSERTDPHRHQPTPPKTDFPWPQVAKFIADMPLMRYHSLSAQPFFRLWPMPTPGIRRFSCAFGAGRFKAPDRSSARRR